MEMLKVKTIYYLFSPVLSNKDADCQFFAWQFDEFSNLQQADTILKSWFCS
jgi:hypothetical protein